ncbi:DUF1014-domain-containing protein [Pseudovirgaria hyperparasitica]|uniref:DUF1014-domain-containing protein n=1 Tax=Pseudovirgaria hyperparasitica TaxID=470096 RepID=A0A6A6W6X8_9PEZI|nr:DUF1014-domain-containing protein [Pseudovirgaria hyperparasitica]KAF2757666.1 DUF1014-domain-containing protein [Pseudovirgaria hyperparasitica]
MPKKAAGENSKKAAGNARKADAAAAKQAEADKKAAAAEAEQCAAAEEKQAEALRKKAEKAALLAEEEASLPSKPKGAGAKKAEKKPRGIDSAFSDLDGQTSKKATSLNATGIDNALDALSLTSNTNESIDRHPERRFKAAYTQYEERRLEEMKDEKGLRRNQKIDQIRKEFEKHPDNPFNQVAGKFNSTREELRDIAAGERDKTERRLGGQ